MKKYSTRLSTMLVIFACVVFAFALGVYSYIKDDYTVATVAVVFGIVLVLYSIWLNRNKARDMAEYISLITGTGSTMAQDAIVRFPLAMAVLRIDGQIMWYNEMFSELLGEADLYSVSLPAVMPGLKWSSVLKSVDKVDEVITYKQNVYNVVGNIIKSKDVTDENGNPVYSVLLYFIDRTEIENLSRTYEAEKTDVAIITIDNYDELSQKMDEAQYQETMSKINGFISRWVSKGKGVMKKTERDRYVVMFEHQYLEEYIKNKFDVLDQIRGLGEKTNVPVTISIGIGTGGHLLENETAARAAIDMAWGRGGDQVAIKDDTQFQFYGGKTKDYEKSTRVKTRTFAVALRDLIAHADNVLFMGHSMADFDSFGAAIGMQRAVRTMGKPAYIVYDHSPAVARLAEKFREIPEYEGMLVNNTTAMELLTDKSLLIVLDAHRPSMVSCPELLESANKVVVIDHHRRSTDFVENCALIYHEPYASSTCEMVTEILQYVDDNRSMTTFEASALYVGILLDTKDFTVKTGVRTFEAASYLKRYGLNTVEVKKLFNVDKDDFLHRIEIERNAEVFADNMVIAVCSQSYHNMRVIASQAADNMLNINGVNAAFVVYPSDDAVCVSARSLGEVNVQVIVEKLGGGGHMSVAGAQVKGATPFDVSMQLKHAIEAYIAENKAE